MKGNQRNFAKPENKNLYQNDANNYQNQGGYNNNRNDSNNYQNQQSYNNNQNSSQNQQTYNNNQNSSQNQGTYNNRQTQGNYNANQNNNRQSDVAPKNNQNDNRQNQGNYNANPRNDQKVGGYEDDYYSGDDYSDEDDYSQGGASHDSYGQVSGDPMPQAKDEMTFNQYEQLMQRYQQNLDIGELDEEVKFDPAEMNNDFDGDEFNLDEETEDTTKKSNTIAGPNDQKNISTQQLTAQAKKALYIKRAFEKEKHNYEMDQNKQALTSKKQTSSYLKVLMVAEKPSIAKTLAEALSDTPVRQRKGRSPACPIYEYEGNISGHKALFKSTSVAGHVYNRDFPIQYSSWEHTNP